MKHGADSDWRFVVPVEPRATYYDWQEHLNNSAAVKLLEHGRIRYITEGLGEEVREAIATNVVMVVRELHVRYESEAFQHEPLVCAVRCVSRTEKAFVLEQELREGAGRVIVKAWLVMLMVDPGVGVIPLPDWFWTPVESLEGHPIPVHPAGPRPPWGPPASE